MTRVFKNGLAFSTTTPHLPTQDYQGQPPLMDSDHHTTRAPPLRRSTRIRNVRYDILSLSIHQPVHFPWYPVLPRFFVWEERRKKTRRRMLCNATRGLGWARLPPLSSMTYRKKSIDLERVVFQYLLLPIQPETNPTVPNPSPHTTDPGQCPSRRSSNNKEDSRPSHESSRRNQEKSAGDEEEDDESSRDKEETCSQKGRAQEIRHHHRQIQQRNRPPKDYRQRYFWLRFGLQLLLPLLPHLLHQPQSHDRHNHQPSRPSSDPKQQIPCSRPEQSHKVQTQN